MNRREILGHLSIHLRQPINRLDALLSTAPYRYRHYQIPKRSGGMRDIYQPTAVLKEAQRWLIAGPLSGLPVSSAVYSYRTGVNIRDQAAVHVRGNYFARFDFTDFFPSIRGDELLRFLERSSRQGLSALDEDVLDLVVRVTCRQTGHASWPQGLALTIGAPSSPFLSNAILYPLDEQLRLEARGLGVAFTRYADDIFFSAQKPEQVRDMEAVFRQCVGKICPFLTINEVKTRRPSRRSRVRICGVNVTSERKLSVGRDMKRSARAALHQLTIGTVDVDEANRVRGMLAYIESIEAGFIARLERKYGRYDAWQLVGPKRD